MKCPVDGTTLVMTDRSGVEIDYCPECRGVWLDRGELDKIVERAAVAPAREAQGAYDDDWDDDRYDPRPGGKRRKKRGGLLGEIFDF